MRILIEIECDGAAFEGREYSEALDTITSALSYRHPANQPFRLMDSNGNRCGTLWVVE